MELEKFKKIGLTAKTLPQLKKKGFTVPTSIQEKTIPHLMKNETDLIAKASTGTGKTAAFGLPIIELLDRSSNNIQALVLVPTRELAIQVTEEIRSFTSDENIRILAVYGGQSISDQIRSLKRGVSIVVGTPGRIMDHLERKTLDVSKITFAVLDEADEMLNMGFIDDIETILAKTNPTKKTLLFSATMPERILKIAKRYMHEYEVIRADQESSAPVLIDQVYCVVSPKNRFGALCRIIEKESGFYGLIFCKTRRDVDDVTAKLVERGFGAEAIHGDISQPQREKILIKFRKKQITILVATDVAARGIDVSNLTHVINHSLPQDPETYVHRIGRTGRAGQKGKAITLVSPSELRGLKRVEYLSGKKILQEEVPTVKDVISSKELSFIADINACLLSDDYKKHLDFAKKLLANNDPAAVVSSMLSRSFAKEISSLHHDELIEKEDSFRPGFKPSGHGYQKKSFGSDDRKFGGNKKFGGSRDRDRDRDRDRGFSKSSGSSSAGPRKKFDAPKGDNKR